MKPKRIVFVGVAGCGKTTLASEVFTYIKKKNKNVELITEWIRTDIQFHGPMQSIYEQYRTRMHQQELEDAVPSDVEYIVTDSGTLTHYFYACLYASKADARQRIVLQDMFRYFTNDLWLKRYSHVFFLPAENTYKANANILNDGTRYQTIDEIALLETHMSMMFTKLHKLDNVYEIKGPLNTRIEEVVNILNIA